MSSRFLTILTGRNLPKIPQPREPAPSIVNEKMIADFTRVVKQTGILVLPKYATRRCEMGHSLICGMSLRA
jgi:hypothetical protein